ncbi:MAG: hypothetical protein C0592_03800 [Marinilabiliales bacterium]|nr:MAG: hypothetical protein C0592_03800 [Marinilabiliales bacterium]
MRIFLSVFFIACTMFAFSQTIVSTSVEDKNVLIEEFTGIHCGYCPDGHVKAQAILNANPGDAWAINIHQGGYATPSAGEPDFRTPWGDAIAGQSGLTGYPAGTVNRHLFASWSQGSGTAMSRSYWDDAAAVVLGETSCVNVAVDADVDYATRQATVLVEVYYTSNSAQSTNYLNLAIIQDWIKGPQSGASTYNPSMIDPSDGMYWHMHMLRELITGQWGIALTQTTAGTFWDSTFVFTVPADYYGIPVELANCEMIAFVTESQQEVYTAHGDYFPPPALDAGIASVSNVPEYTCIDSFIPTVNLKNYGLDTLESVDIVYYVEGETPATYNWTGSLLTGADVDVILPAVVTAVNGSANFIAKTVDPNSSSDMNVMNDSSIVAFAVFGASGAAPLTQDFASTTFPPTNMVAVDADGDGKNWIRSSAGHNAGGSAFINFYSISSGQKDDLMISPLDFTGMSNMALTFYVAYRQYTSENDRLQVDVSTDCGSTWTQVWTKAGSSLATTTASTSNYSTPLSSHWRLEVVDLTTYDGSDDVMLRFRSTSNYGNNLFLDDINIDAGAAIVENDVVNVLNLFPNPANDATTLKIQSNSSSDAMIVIYNTIGEKVYASSTYVNKGSNDVNLNTSDLANGMYVVQVQIGAEMYNLRLSIAR